MSGQVSKSQASVNWSLSLDPLGLLVNGSCELALRSSTIFQMPSAKVSGAPDKASCLGLLTSTLAMFFLNVNPLCQMACLLFSVNWSVNWPFDSHSENGKTKKAGRSD